MAENRHDALEPLVETLALQMQCRSGLGLVARVSQVGPKGVDEAALPLLVDSDEIADLLVDEGGDEVVAVEGCDEACDAERDGVGHDRVQTPR